MLLLANIDHSHALHARNRCTARKQLNTAGICCCASAQSNPPAIRAIVTDVDGTLLNHAQQLTRHTADTLNAAVEAGVPVVLATGKAKGPWLKDVAPLLRLQHPTVFLQGLMIYAPDGSLMHSHTLEQDVCLKALDFARQHSLTVTVYSDDRILCAKCDQHTDRLLFYRCTWTRC